MGFFIIITFGGETGGFYHTNWLDDPLLHQQNCHNYRHHFEIPCMALFCKMDLKLLPISNRSSFLDWIFFSSSNFLSSAQLQISSSKLLVFLSKSSSNLVQFSFASSASFFKYQMTHCQLWSKSPETYLIYRKIF